MKVKLSGVRRIYIKSEYIKLDALLKFAFIAASGGEAKFLIQDGKILVNGETCTLRGKKIRPGDVVQSFGDILLVLRTGINDSK